MKTSLENAAIIAASLILSLSSAEGISRVIWTKPWYESLVEAQFQTEWRANIKPNAYGLRDQDYANLKPPNTKRILLLGDSYTYGSGLADDSAIFAELLEKQLNAQPASPGRKIEILNGGIHGSMTGDWVDLLLRVKDSFQPDICVIVFSLRDGTRTTAMGSFFDPIRKQIAQRNQRSMLWQHLYLYRVARDYRDRRFISATYADAINISYFGSGSQTDEWRAAQFNIRKIKAIGEETNTRTALVVFPILAELSESYPFKDVCDLMVHYGEELDLPTLDLLPAFMSKNASDLWVSPHDQHPNAEGHRIAAEALLPFLRQLLSE